MKIRALIVAIAAFVATASGAAQPSKSESRPLAPARPRAAPVVLASASEARGPSTAPDVQRPADPAKRRVARVTTCRCGDPHPEESQQDQ
jgi:hypothetical protein